jgi:hypothetical protein
MLTLLGLLVIAIILTERSGTGVLQFLGLALGVAALALAAIVWRATSVGLVLTAEALRDGAGRLLTPVAAIEAVDRGAFAFKPSNGFGLRLAAPVPMGWAPGLWWRFGRKLGVGGITSGVEARHMAQTISALLAERAGH